MEVKEFSKNVFRRNAVSFKTELKYLCISRVRVIVILFYTKMSPNSSKGSEGFHYGDLQYLLLHYIASLVLWG